MKANLRTSEESGSDEKDDIPEEVTLTKTLHSNETFSERFYDVEGARDKMSEAGSNLERSMTIHQKV